MVGKKSAPGIAYSGFKPFLYHSLATDAGNLLNLSKPVSSDCIVEVLQKKMIEGASHVTENIQWENASKVLCVYAV